MCNSVVNSSYKLEIVHIFYYGTHMSEIFDGWWLSSQLKSLTKTAHFHHTRPTQMRSLHNISCILCQHTQPIKWFLLKSSKFYMGCLDKPAEVPTLLEWMPKYLQRNHQLWSPSHGGHQALILSQWRAWLSGVETWAGNLHWTCPFQLTLSALYAIITRSKNCAWRSYFVPFR